MRESANEKKKKKKRARARKDAGAVREEETADDRWGLSFPLRNTNKLPSVLPPQRTKTGQLRYPHLIALELGEGRDGEQAERGG